MKMKEAMISIREQFPEAARENLIPMLQEMQEKQGYLSIEAVKEVGNYLDIPESRVFGVATFYNQFRFEPLGKYHVQVCRGTACHVLGSANVLSALEVMLKTKAGQTSRDGMFSLEVVACIGACGLAPVISINGEFHARITEDSLAGIIDQYTKAEENGSTESNKE